MHEPLSVSLFIMIFPYRQTLILKLFKWYIDDWLTFAYDTRDKPSLAHFHHKSYTIYILSFGKPGRETRDSLSSQILLNSERRIWWDPVSLVLLYHAFEGVEFLLWDDYKNKKGKGLIIIHWDCIQVIKL